MALPPADRFCRRRSCHDHIIVVPVRGRFHEHQHHEEDIDYMCVESGREQLVPANNGSADENTDKKDIKASN